MGGLGSGEWSRYNAKTTVESSSVLAMKIFRGCIVRGYIGQITWTRGNGNKSSIGYRVNWNETGPIMTLFYRWADKEDIEIPVRLQSTPMQFTGVRWWFTCPLIVDGVPCNRRVGNLYRPGVSRYFGCRHCHRLTYQSCQQAHSVERWQDRLLSRKFAGQKNASGGDK